MGQPTQPGLTGPWGPGLYDTQGPVGEPQPMKVTITQAWRTLITQLGTTNVRYAKDANKNLRAVNALTRR